MRNRARPAAAPALHSTALRGALAASLALTLPACAGSYGGPEAAAPTTAPAPTAASAPAPVAPAALVEQVQIPFERFVLDNGLTVIVHTDRKAPIVGVTTYYKVGSKNEPQGRTGFAHLYEHLFFGGSANVPNFDVPLEGAGSTPTNGSTWYDRTNYVETVPTGALDLALFMESDRMGHLLPAVTQDKLDKQRGVVQNEKRQGDNQPYGLLRYLVGNGLFPVGHPYRHSTIGSMADLDAATLGDVRKWFTDHYGPNNVVLVLSGDIDAAAARPLVEKWFGAIPRGPAIRPVEAGPVTLPAPVSRDMTDRVPMLAVTRNWSGPGLNDPDAPALQIGMAVLGGLASSRLDNALVRGKELAVGVTASAELYEQVSLLSAMMQVKPGIDRALAEAELDAVIRRLVTEGPTKDELDRAVMRTLSDQIGALEVVGGFGGKGSTLAEGEVYSGDPAHYAHDLKAMAALTPETVRAALAKWLSRPAFNLAVVPGERTLDGGKLGGWADGEAPEPAAPKDAKARIAPLPAAPKRAFPPVAPVADLAFPAIEHATLSNGIPVSLARRTAVPKVELALSFDAGFAADALDTPGTQGTMLDALEQGTDVFDATALAEAQERLGARIDASATPDATRVTLSALSANLRPSLDLFAGVVRRPAFRADDVARVKQQRLAALAQAEASPNALAQRTLAAEIYAGTPYALGADGLGNGSSLEALTPEALKAAHARWMRPGLARITVVGDVTMAQLLPLLEDSLGRWQNGDAPLPKKALDAPVPAPAARLVLIDRPGSPQSVVLAGRVLPVTGRTSGTETLDLANAVLGGGFLSRLNLDLREEKGWSYGVYSSVTSSVGRRALVVQAPVQADRTGDTVRTLLSLMQAFPKAKPVTREELDRVTEGEIRQMPTQFETNGAVLAAIDRNAMLGRPDDYYETLPATYRAAGAKAIEAAATQYLSPEGMTFVVVGDRKLVEPQLKGLKLPVEVRAAAKP